FFQAEDGIRVFHVTGVQTCALPILISPSRLAVSGPWLGSRSRIRMRKGWARARRASGPSSAGRPSATASGATRRSGGPEGAGVPGGSLRAVAMDRTLPTPRAARCRGSSPQGERVARGEVVARTLGVGTPAFGALVLAPQRGPFGGLLRRAVARAACGGRLGGSAHGAEELRDDDGRGGGGVEGHRGPPGAVGAAEARPMTSL